MHRFANIIVDISHESVDRPFSYIIPEKLAEYCKPGVRVSVPFGKGNKLIDGYILEVTDETNIDESKLKYIDSILVKQDEAEGRMIALAGFIKEQYGSTMITALKTVLPIKQPYKPKEKKTIELVWQDVEAKSFLADCIRKHQYAKERLLRELIPEKVLDYHLVTQKLNVSSQTLNSLLKTGILTIRSENYFRNPVVVSKTEYNEKILNEEQKKVIDEFSQDYDNDIRKTYLIHGVTGSGKTEVYIQMIKKVIERGKQAIVLIPEIALTYQTIVRFYKHFAQRVTIMNSSLSQGEKYDQCERAKRGEIDIIIGPRSALFTPFRNIGLIIIDEEHENSYKNENMPKYHAREVAIEIARMHNASVVLGSATPSIDSYYHAINGDYKLFTLKKRASGGALPEVYIVDLRKELRDGNRSIFSKKLQELILDRLEKREQIMLFLNRRGYAGFISCRLCGHTMKCPHCDVSLSEHKNGKLICHYCGYEMIKPPLCPKCGSKYLLSFRAGTEQIEEQIHKVFPKTRVLRMDGDTTKKKDSYEKILSAFSDGEADILIGTQMIVKGHDFPNVTLVGILAADLSLSANDYRASERTFELLTQAAGRAGRGLKSGEVVIQTYQPEHYSVMHAAAQDYEGFYDEEILYREISSYPPVFQILATMVVSMYEKTAEEIARKLAFSLKESKNYEMIKVIGPAPAGISKMKDYYRNIFYIKSKDKKYLVEMKDLMERKLMSDIDKKDTGVQFDFNPMNPY